MPTVPVLDTKGKAQEQLELSADVFGGPVRVPLLHQSVVKELAARRAGTHDTKGRSEVSGAAGSRGSKRGPGGRARARSAPPNGREVASPLAPPPASTTRRCRRRCGARPCATRWPPRSPRGK